MAFTVAFGYTIQAYTYRILAIDKSRHSEKRKKPEKRSCLGSVDCLAPLLRCIRKSVHVQQTCQRNDKNDHVLCSTAIFPQVSYIIIIVTILNLIGERQAEGVDSQREFLPIKCLFRFTWSLPYNLLIV